MRLLRRTLVAVLALGAVIGFLRIPVSDADAQETAETVQRPKLAVLVVFDQLRGDYLKKWQPLFVEGGFKRLQTEGAWFANCHYPYAYTLTAPGHASLSTGATPSKHGIIANDWYDRAHDETVTSVTPPPEKIRLGRGPYRRQAQTIGDVLLDVLKGRVVSLSIKDRAAILLAAIRAQACYWFDGNNGTFVTSPHYRETPHSWVKNFNKSKLADKWLNKDWVRFKPDLDYEKHSGPDDLEAEGVGYGQGHAFPHPTTVNAKEKDPAKAKSHYYEAMENSPYGNDLLLSLAKTAIVAEKLGQGETTDLLCVSFSSNDLVGHCWGPDSQEVLDMTLRSDTLIQDFLNFLDAKVGKGNYVFAVSADHGVCPLPEVSSKHGKGSGRVLPETLTTRTEAFLNKTFLPAGSKAPWFEDVKKLNPWIYLNRGTIKALDLDQTKVETALAEWFTTQEGIEAAFTRSDLMGQATPGKDTPLREMMRKSFHAESSGDVMVVLKPYHLFSPALLSKNLDKIKSFRTSHGTPHPYDTHVPLLVMGPRVQPGTREDRVTPQAMASILAEALRIPAPKDAEYPVPTALFGK